MSILQVFGVGFLTLAALMALALNFTTHDAPSNYRNALYGLFAAQIGVAAFLSYDMLNGMWGIAAVTAALLHATGVVLYNRTIMLTARERLALFYNPKFWITSVVSVGAIIVLLIINSYQQ